MSTVIRRIATWPMASLLMLLMWAGQLGFMWRHDRLGGVELLDRRQWYTPDQAAAVFAELDRLDSGARQLYALTELTLDMAFPLAYGLLFAILLSRLFEGGGRLWVLLPLVAAAADVLENLSISYLALTFVGPPTAVAWVAAGFTAAKSGLILASLLAVLFGAVRGLLRRPRPGSGRT